MWFFLVFLNICLYLFFVVVGVWKLFVDCVFFLYGVSYSVIFCVDVIFDKRGLVYWWYLNLVLGLDCEIGDIFFWRYCLVCKEVWKMVVFCFELFVIWFYFWSRKMDFEYYFWERMWRGCFSCCMLYLFVFLEDRCFLLCFFMFLGG